MQPIRDSETVSAAGESVQTLPDGVSLRDVQTHVDERGSVFELFDERWAWHAGPLVFSYCFTVRPGMVKGWGIHERHDDRYVLLFGEAKVVLYDERPDSPTSGLIAEVMLTCYRRRLLSIPAGIWHATQNLSTNDVVIVNFPTMPYDHASPDKYRVPLDTDRIPYRFDGVRGW